MSLFTSDFLNILSERGFLHQVSHEKELDLQAKKGNLTAYVGYDCTAPSLHVGSLLSMMMLLWLEKTGTGKAIVLMGGGTTRVGDPSGRDETRKILTPEVIESHKNSIKSVCSRFLPLDNPQKAFMLDNAEWLLSINYIDFLRDIGKHFSVNRMLSMESVKNRLEREQELSFIEFNYMLLQAYDFVHLAKNYGCLLQMGGSDQWGNIVQGIDLGRRLSTPQLFGVTCPLLTTSSGAKMGKTVSGAVWLNADLLSPYDYWQYWRNTEDLDVGRFLKLFTLLPLSEIKKLEMLSGQEINEAKKILATEVTALLHGRDAAEAARKTALETFEKHHSSAGLPRVYLSSSFISSGLSILQALVDAGLCSSKGEAKRLIAGGGVKVNDQLVHDERMLLTRDALAPLDQEQVIKLSLGKKRHVLLVASEVR